MTSQKSSPISDRRTFSPFMYTFSRALSEGFIFPLLNAVYLSIFVVILPAAFTFSPSKNPDVAALLEEGQSIGELYRYVITATAIDEPIIAYLIILGVCLFSALTGVFLFRFMTAKKTVNVYYSLGIKRRSLFLAKYAAGTILLAASVVIPMLMNILVNLHFTGSSPELWHAAAYYAAGLFILSMLCMTVTAAVFSAVGTVLEGTFFSAVILLLPTIFIYCLQFLMSKLLWGSPYGQGSFVYGAEHLSVSEPLAASLSRFNPIFFLADGLNHTALMDAETKPADMMWPNFPELLIWAAVTVVCLGISLLVFQRRKTEICGFLGKNRVLSFIVELALGLTAATAVLYALYGRIPNILAYLIALIAYAVVYWGIELLLTRSVKTALKGAWKLPVHLIFPIAAFAVFATGLFGYESRIPDPAEIDKVYVEADYDFGLYAEEGGPTSASSSGDGIYARDCNSSLAGALTTERDKQFAAELHRAMIDSKNASEDQIVHRQAAIVYELKDGRTIRRYYPYTTMAECQKSLQLYESDWSRDKLAQIISSDPPAGADSYVYNPANGKITSYNHLEYGYETGSVQIGNGIDFVPLTLTRDQHAALKQALISDINAQTAQDRFSPDRILGYIAFFVAEEGYVYRMGGGDTVYPITENMAHVRRFLEQNQLFSLIPAIPDNYEKIYVREAREFYGTIHFQSKFYTSYYYDLTPNQYYTPSLDIDAAVHKTIDSGQFEAVRDHLITSCHTGDSGYFIILQYPDYAFNFYLPERYATPEIRSLFGA